MPRRRGWSRWIRASERAFSDVKQQVLAFRYEGVRTDKNAREHQIYVVDPAAAKEAVGEIDRQLTARAVAQELSLESAWVEATLAQAVAHAFERAHGRVVDEPVDQRAAATIASPRSSPHCSKPRLEVTMIEPRS